MMVDVLVSAIGVFVAILIGATSYAAIEYYKQLRKAQKEYEKARDVVEDVVLSFNRELRREAERMQNVAYKVEEATAKAESGLRRNENFEKRLEPIENQIIQIGRQADVLDAAVKAVAEKDSETMGKLESINASSLDAKIQEITDSQQKLSEVDTKIHDIETKQDTLKSKIAGLEELMQRLVTNPEIRTDATLSVVPGMPIKRDKALAALTDTEVAVLEFLSAEGPKTAPKIKEKVHLSREHTARLMKKLYEEGYLERETAKLPFKYHVKEEMAKLLKKPEPTAT